MARKTRPVEDYVGERPITPDPLKEFVAYWLRIPFKLRFPFLFLEPLLAALLLQPGEKRSLTKPLCVCLTLQKE